MGVNNAGLNIFAGIPPLPLNTTGRVFFVGNNATLVPGGVAGVDDSGSNGDTPQRPFATWNYAVGRCTANRGDTIILLPGHAETFSAADGVLLNVAGVTTIGLGEGANRPTFTFSGTAGSIRVTAASNTIRNIIGTPSINAVTNPFHLQAADCTLDIEWQDASATVEALRAVLTTAAADRLKINLVYRGFTTGSAVVNAVRLVGCNDGLITVDFYGVLTTAVVEFLTTACTNITVTGKTYVSGITTGARNVVDTQGSGTWYANIDDRAAATQWVGGSGPGNPNAIRTATFTKADVTAATAWSTANSPVTIFTVTGTVLMQVFGRVTTAFTSTASTGTVALGTTNNSAVFIAATTANGTNLALNHVWTTSTTARANALPNTGNWVLVGGDNVTVTIATNNMTAGGIVLYAQWIPITAGATVV